MGSKIRPSVQKMLDNEGIYIAGSSIKPDFVIVMVSKDGKIFSTKLDKELAPDRFLDDFVIRHGPLK